MLSFLKNMYLTLEPGKNMQKIVKYLHVEVLDDFSVFLQSLSVKNQKVFKTIIDFFVVWKKTYLKLEVSKNMQKNR